MIILKHADAVSLNSLQRLISQEFTLNLPENFSLFKKCLFPTFHFEVICAFGSVGDIFFNDFYLFGYVGS